MSLKCWCARGVRWSSASSRACVVSSECHKCLCDWCALCRRSTPEARGTRCRTIGKTMCVVKMPFCTNNLLTFLIGPFILTDILHAHHHQRHRHTLSPHHGDAVSSSSSSSTSHFSRKCSVWHVIPFCRYCSGYVGMSTIVTFVFLRGGRWQHGSRRHTIEGEMMCSPVQQRIQFVHIFFRFMFSVFARTPSRSLFAGRWHAYAMLSGFGCHALCHISPTTAPLWPNVIRYTGHVHT